MQTVYETGPAHFSQKNTINEDRVPLTPLVDHMYSEISAAYSITLQF